MDCLEKWIAEIARKKWIAWKSGLREMLGKSGLPGKVDCGNCWEKVDCLESEVDCEKKRKWIAWNKVDCGSGLRKWTAQVDCLEQVDCGCYKKISKSGLRKHQSGLRKVDCDQKWTAGKWTAAKSGLRQKWIAHEKVDCDESGLRLEKWTAKRF